MARRCAVLHQRRRSSTWSSTDRTASHALGLSDELRFLVDFEAGPHSATVQLVLDAGAGRVARPFGSALTDPGLRLSRTRLFPEVTRIGPLVLSRDA